MTDGLLENIIQLEKAIQAEIASEGVRVEAWQTRELARLQESLAAALNEAEALRQQRMTAEKDALLREGRRRQEAVAAWCAALQNLDDSVLRDTLHQHLAEILPGGDHDHPHGQS